MFYCLLLEYQINNVSDLVVDGMRSVQGALTSLGRPGEMTAWSERTLRVYPELADKIAQVHKEAELALLCAQGDKVMKTQPINWIEGQRIFGRLVELQPQGNDALSC